MIANFTISKWGVNAICVTADVQQPGGGAAGLRGGL